MSLFSRTQPSPAMVVAVVALTFALAGTAIAGPDAITSAVTKSKVKQIAKKQGKKQANKQIRKKAPGLSVANAVNAQNATNATNATNAGLATNAKSLDMYAHVTVSGTVPNVDEGRSKGFTDADIDNTGFTGEYCVTLPAGFKIVHATVDSPVSTFGGNFASVSVLADDVGACAGVGSDGNHIIEVRNHDGTAVPLDFDISVGL